MPHVHRRRLAIALGLLTLVVLGVLAGAFWPTRTRATAPATLPAAGSPELARRVEAGRYVATASDCIACHSTPGGRPFAGGLSLASPIGGTTRPTSRRTRMPASGAIRSTTSTAPCATASLATAARCTRPCPTHRTRGCRTVTRRRSTPSSCKASTPCLTPIGRPTSPARCRCAGPWRSGARPSLRRWRSRRASRRRGTGETCRWRAGPT